ncbi:MAG: thiamine diphosphokinase [Candidatus Marinimicrobia bacterium]|nr:thiamine diphosphokinase [Candidatus Neomarinimicrobiota bacterium]
MLLKPPVIVLANGPFPTHHRPLEALRTAGTLLCCDGAADNLLAFSRSPDFVLGDLDSISPRAREAFADRLVELPSQQSGDLEKALQWARQSGVEAVTIIGATGGRADHALGNLLLMWHDFGLELSALTDSGSFLVVRGARELPSFPGQPVALFPEAATVKLTSRGLTWELTSESLPAMHRGVSNRSRADKFFLEAAGGLALVFQGYPD